MNINGVEWLNNQYVVIATALFLGLYGLALGRMELPDYIRNLFTNNIFRVVWLSLLLIFNLNKAPHVGIAIALIFVLTLNYLNQMEVKENFIYLESFRNQIKNRNQ
jgi:hypothetical protein